MQVRQQFRAETFALVMLLEPAEHLQKTFVRQLVFSRAGHRKTSMHCSSN